MPVDGLPRFPVSRAMSARPRTQPSWSWRGTLSSAYTMAEAPEPA